MDFIIRLFRVLAFESRLQIVQFVLGHPGAIVKQVSSALSLPMSATSKYVRLLSDHGVIGARPSGGCVLTGPENPRSTGHVILKCVRRSLKKYLGDSTLQQASRGVCPDRDATDWADVHRAMCFDFTAYTHLRRLLLLRMLCSQERADLETIVREIGMSYTAARRQIDKLSRRGLVNVQRSKEGDVLTMPAEIRTPHRASLFQAVQDYLTAD